MGMAREGNCPKYRVYLDEYYIGVYCITNRQYKRFVDETGHRPPDHSDYSQAAPIWKGKGYPKEKPTIRWWCVSWDDAVAYCVGGIKAADGGAVGEGGKGDPAGMYIHGVMSGWGEVQAWWRTGEEKQRVRCMVIRKG